MNTKSKRSTWVIIPVHNRRETTLSCLEHLSETQKWEQFNIVVVDDGSTDGTPSAVRERYPGVTVLEGDGSLWWGGAIRKGMKYAANQDADVFVWLNDDVLPEPGGVTKLATKVHELGDTVLTTMVHTEPESDYTTRNEVNRWGVKNLPYQNNLEIQPADVVAGKFTAFPRDIIEKIGFPDDNRFPHHNCDYDYSLRAKEAGFSVGVFSDVSATDIGYNPQNVHGRLSPERTLKGLIIDTFDSSRHEWYSLKTAYHRDIRFCGPPLILSYIILIYHMAKSILSVIVKSILTIVETEHRFERGSH